MAKRVLTPPSEDFPRWYQDVISKAELADNGPVRGTMVVRPYGYALWERMQQEVDLRIKRAGAQNAYFPLFIPDAFIRREAEHVEGFSPELAVVTHAGGKELEEPVIVRPTSETIINHFIGKWVQSYRDLPMLINQWANVVRWELRPRVFLRTTEFLWQEGHTAHATSGEAAAYARQILHDVYADFMVNVLAIPVLAGRKTPAERFPGATTSLTCEAMMRDGKALQMGTSHELGQNFARMFDIQYLDEAGEQQFAWQTSWGVSTRMVGGLIMTHGDEAGLQIPPRLAPVQAVVLVVRDEGASKSRAAALADELRDEGLRVELDDRADQSFGRRTVDWELKGVPVRIEIGPRDLAEGNATVARRDDGSKTAVPLPEVTKRVVATLADIQEGLLARAKQDLDEHTVDAASVDEAVEGAREGFVRIPWRLLGDGAEEHLAGQGITVRCLLTGSGGVPDTDDPEQDPDLVAYVGRAY